MTIFDATFTSGQVTAAAGVSNAVLQTWIRRDLIIGHKGGGVDMPGRPGVRRSFSIFNLVEVSIGAALVNAGVDLRHAFRAAGHFAHTSSKAHGLPMRLPALPYPGPRHTVVCVAGERSVELAWEPRRDLWVEARSELGHPDGITMISASDVFDRALRTVGYDPRKVLHEAYGEGTA